MNTQRNYRPTIRLDPHEQPLRELEEPESFWAIYRWVILGGLLWVVAYLAYYRWGS